MTTFNLIMAAIRHFEFVVRVWTTHMEHLVILIVVQNLESAVQF